MKATINVYFIFNKNLNFKISEKQSQNQFAEVIQTQLPSCADTIYFFKNKGVNTF